MYSIFFASGIRFIQQVLQCVHSRLSVGLRRFSLLLIAVSAVILLLPKLISAACLDLGLIQFTKALQCDRNWYVCVGLLNPRPHLPQEWSGNAVFLSQSSSFLQAALAIRPTPRIYLRLAEVEFSQGKRVSALDRLVAGTWSTRCTSSAEQNTSPRNAQSLLSMPSQYEHHLIEGYQCARLQDWFGAVREFRLGLAYAGERVLPQDVQAFYNVTAHMYLTQATSDVAYTYLAGKYSVLAGNWKQGSELLKHMILPESGLNEADRARAATYLGIARYAQGDIDGAIEAHRAGWQTTDVVRENGVYLISLLRKQRKTDEAKRIESRLEVLGPEFRAGSYGPNYEVNRSIILPSGHTFFGYDLDEQDIAAGSPLNLMIWWKKPKGDIQSSSNRENAIELSQYLILAESGTNMIPNAGLEWGQKQDSLPEGWDERIYSSAPDSAYVGTAMRKGLMTRVAIADNTRYTSSGFINSYSPVDRKGLYLMAGWINDTGSGNIGRVCAGRFFQPGGPYYIADAHSRPPRPKGTWIHASDVATPFPEEAADECRLLLINYNAPGGITMWDDLILMRIEVP